jgi:hypothetical protein
MPKKSTPSTRRGRPPKIKSKPPERTIKIKHPGWYGGEPRATWVKKEERALVMWYIVDWQKRAPADDDEDNKMTTKEFDEMHLLRPPEKVGKNVRILSPNLHKNL